MTDAQTQFINLYSFKKKNYAEIEKLMDIDRKQLHNILDEEVGAAIKHIQSIYSKFTNERRNSFSEFKEFYDWYEEQGQKCGYCGVTQENLYKLFDKEKRVLPYLDKNKTYEKAPKRSSGTLEIERLDSSSNYQAHNMILACPLCNNAKSNLIDAENWKNIFAPAMKIYYDKLLRK